MNEPLSLNKGFIERCLLLDDSYERTQSKEHFPNIVYSWQQDILYTFYWTMNTTFTLLRETTLTRVTSRISHLFLLNNPTSFSSKYFITNIFHQCRNPAFLCTSVLESVITFSSSQAAVQWIPFVDDTYKTTEWKRELNKNLCKWKHKTSKIFYPIIGIMIKLLSQFSLGDIEYF